MLFDIQRFAVNDGPGIRTTVFLKGCLLQCVWCHNPESQSASKQLGYLEDNCTLCGKCAEVCPEGVHSLRANAHAVNFKACTACGLCVEACPSEALRMYGYTSEVSEIMDEVVKDRPYYQTSGGGITLSGGEPLYQFGFATELLEASRHARIHTCVDTTGFVASERLQKTARLTDVFLYDYKITDPTLHKSFTGVALQPILDNLFMLNRLGAFVILRCPIIPDINFNPQHLEAISQLALQLPAIRQVDLLPYHTTGNSKYHRIGNQLPFEAKNIEKAELAPWQIHIEKVSGKVVTVG